MLFDMSLSKRMFGGQKGGKCLSCFQVRNDDEKLIHRRGKSRKLGN